MGSNQSAERSSAEPEILPAKAVKQLVDEPDISPALTEQEVEMLRQRYYNLVDSWKLTPARTAWWKRKKFWVPAATCVGGVIAGGLAVGGILAMKAPAAAAPAIIGGVGKGLLAAKVAGAAATGLSAASIGVIAGLALLGAVVLAGVSYLIYWVCKRSSQSPPQAQAAQDAEEPGEQELARIVGAQLALQDQVRDLMAANEALRAAGGENQICSVCMESPKTVAYSCGHMFCAGCAANPACARCAICRRNDGIRIPLFH